MSIGHEQPPLDLRAAVRIARSRWGWVLVPLLLLTAVQLGLALRATPMYSSSVDMLLRGKATDGIVSGVEDPNAIGSNDFFSDRVIATEIKVISSDAVFSAATKKLGFEAIVTATGDPDAAILQITAEDADPRRAAKIANTYAEVYRDFRRAQTLDDISEASAELKKAVVAYQGEIDLYNVQLGAEDTPAANVESLRAKRDAAQKAKDSYQSRIDALTVDASLKSGAAKVLTPALPATQPFSPRPARSAATGLLAGLILGLGLAFLREFMDDRIYGQPQLATIPGAPQVLGFIPRTRRSRMRKLKPGEAADVPAEAIESYRSLRSAITFLGADQPLKIIQVTSAVPAEGKSTTVTNLAHVMSQSGMRVLVIDADLRSPTLHETFGLLNDVGLSNVLAGEVGITTAAKTLSDDGDLTVLTAGPTPPNAAELLGSWRAKDVFGAIRPYFDVVLVDGPPLLAVTDPIVVGQFVDAVLLVTRSKKSRKREVRNALDLLRRSHRRVIGVVVNATPRRRALGLMGYGYGYGNGTGGYGYGEYGKAPRRRRRPTAPPTTRTVEAWVPDDSPMWTAPLGTGWTSDHDLSRDALGKLDNSLEATAQLSSGSQVVRVPNDASVLLSSERIGDDSPTKS
jgi:polysaccharide biosynthesis transport protein